MKVLVIGIKNATNSITFASYRIRCVVLEHMNNSTIAAISSGMTTSGIGIIRISGDDAVAVADKVYYAGNVAKLDEVADGGAGFVGKKLADVASHTVNVGTIHDGDENLDEAVVLVMRGPNSFTGEDVVEIQCHGGPYVMKRVLEAVLRAGAVMAEPGEFTKRAFLHGRMDLSEAESVMQLIEARSDYALKASFAGLKGAIKREISDIRGKLLYDTAFLEAALDDPEHISLEGFGKRLGATVDSVIERIDTLIKGAEEGRILREGINTVILGRPNAGKSTLLNALLGEERAIVTSVPGTTRDTLEESVRIGGVVLRLVDTAGLRDASDEVEKIGVDLARKAASGADLVLYVVDNAKGLDAKEASEIAGFDKVIVVYNKVDLDGANAGLGPDAELSPKNALPSVKISAKFGNGLDDLKSTIQEMFYKGELESGEELMIANTRQKKLLEGAKEALLKVREGLEIGVPEDLLTVDLMDAHNSLGLITGETASGALADEIFDKFCMGK